MNLDIENSVGQFFSEVTLEIFFDSTVNRRRMRPLTHFHMKTRVEVDKKLRENYSLGTKFIADVKVCQKHFGRSPNGPPYLKVYSIKVV